MACVKTQPGAGWSNDWHDKEFSDGYESSCSSDQCQSDAESDISTFSDSVNMIHQVQQVEHIIKTTQLVTRLKSLNNFSVDSVVSDGYLPFVCDNITVGIISPAVTNHLRQFPQFVIHEDRVSFHEDVRSVSDRSLALHTSMISLRDAGVFSNALMGWRNECYEIRNKFADPVMFHLERAASPLFGVRKYGVQINGYVQHSTLGTCLWLQQRSLLKPTWPGMMDNFVGGGVTEGLTVAETAVKEAAEEAGVDDALAAKLVPVGSVSFLHRTERGVHPNTEFVFDLELPEHYVPHNTDGEVGGWTLVPVDMVLDIVCSDKFKITSSPVVIDFLVRWGFIEPTQEILDLLRVPLDILYKYFNIKLQ